MRWFRGPSLFRGELRWCTVGGRDLVLLRVVSLDLFTGVTRGLTRVPLLLLPRIPVSTTGYGDSVSGYENTFYLPSDLRTHEASLRRRGTSFDRPCRDSGAPTDSPSVPRLRRLSFVNPETERHCVLSMRRSSVPFHCPCFPSCLFAKTEVPRGGPNLCRHLTSPPSFLLSVPVGRPSLLGTGGKYGVEESCVFVKRWSFPCYLRQSSGF